MDNTLSISEQKAQQRRIALATLVGTTIEWYDYFIYAAVAGLVFDQLFLNLLAIRSLPYWYLLLLALPFSFVRLGHLSLAIWATKSVAKRSWH